MDPLRWAFWQKKYRRESAKSWNLFYRRNETRFFRDRHWLGREFPELLDPSVRRVLELGCGVGNTALPLAEEKCAASMSALSVGNAPKALFACPTHDPCVCAPPAPLQPGVFACDFSEQAINLLKADPRCATFGIHAFVCDIVAGADDIDLLASSPPTHMDPGLHAAKDLDPCHVCTQGNFPPGTMDAATAIFVLSAIPPEKHALAVRRIAAVLRPGGVLFLRDYCVNDAAMTRFKSDRKLGDSLYVRQDGTLSYFFDPDLLSALFTSGGLFAVSSCGAVESETVNAKEDMCLPRLFVQAKFVRTCASPHTHA